MDSPLASATAEDEYHFQNAIMDMVLRIEKEMQTYGDDTDEPNSLKNIEFKIQSNRILKILEILIEKIEIGFCLPHIIREDDTWQDLVPCENERIEIMEFYKLFDEIEQTDENHLENDETDFKITNGINLIQSSELNTLVPKYLQNISENEMEFLESLRELKQLTEWRIMMTAPKAMAKEKLLHNMWTENEKIKVRIEELKMQLDKVEKKFNDNYEQKRNIIETNKKKIAELKQESFETIQHEITGSKRVMNRTCMESEARQAELLEQAEKIKEDYETLLRSSLAAQKKMGENKLKVQQKLQSWLTKYDNDIGEKSKELFRLTDLLAEEQRVFREWQHNYDKQEIEFNIMMEEKEIEENRIREEKLVIFMMNRAATLIQRTYRKLLKQRKKKKGKGKGKKGKK